MAIDLILSKLQACLDVVGITAIQWHKYLDVQTQGTTPRE